MKKVAMNDEKRDRLLLRMKMRQETGIDPVAITSDMRALQRTAQTIDDIMRRLEDAHVFPEGAWFNPLIGFKKGYEEALYELKTNMTRAFMAEYRNRYLPNLNLSTNAFQKLMTEKAGADGYDAIVIENAMLDIMEKAKGLSFEQILRQAQSLLPRFEPNTPLEVRMAKILRGKRLRLHARLTKLSEKEPATTPDNRVTLRFEYRVRVMAVEKLSRILLNRDNPANVQAQLRDLIPFGYTSTENILKKCCPGKPIASVQFHLNGTFIVEYETLEQAHKVAETLLNDKQALEEYSPEAQLCHLKELCS